MEQWTPDVWLAIGAAFFVGIVVGCAIVRVLKGNVKQHIQLETELKATKEKLRSKNNSLSNISNNPPHCFQRLPKTIKNFIRI